MMTIKQYLRERAKEPSTWRGVIMLVGALVGYTVDAQVSESLVTILVAMAGSGVAGIVTKDK